MAKKVDRNQREMVASLRAIGFRVAHTHTIGKGFPDIVVCGRNWLTDEWPVSLVEIKTLKGDLSPDEKVFHEEWEPGKIVIARRPSDVMLIYQMDYDVCRSVDEQYERSLKDLGIEP